MTNREIAEWMAFFWGLGLFGDQPSIATSLHMRRLALS